MTIDTLAKSVSMKLVHRKGDSFEKMSQSSQKKKKPMSSPYPKTGHTSLFKGNVYGFRLIAQVVLDKRDPILVLFSKFCNDYLLAVWAGE